MSRSPTLHVARFWFALVLIVSECAWAADAKIEAGATIYGNYCSNCHGDGLGGWAAYRTERRFARSPKFGSDRGDSGHAGSVGSVPIRRY